MTSTNGAPPQAELRTGSGRSNYRTMRALVDRGLVTDVRKYGPPSAPTMLATGVLTDAGLAVLAELRERR